MMVSSSPGTEVLSLVPWAGCPRGLCCLCVEHPGTKKKRVRKGGKLSFGKGGIPRASRHAVDSGLVFYRPLESPLLIALFSSPIPSSLLLSPQMDDIWLPEMNKDSEMASQLFTVCCYVGVLVRVFAVKRHHDHPNSFLKLIN